MTPKRNLRRQFFVDPRVQGGLVWRLLLYWMLCLGMIFAILLCWRMITGPARVFYTHFDDMWFHYGPAFIVSLMLLPLVIVDVIRYSNRFAGPMLRLRRAMRDLARGARVEPIHFRRGDFWHDFAEEFNAVAERVQRASPARESGEPELEPVGAAAGEE